MAHPIIKRASWPDLSQLTPLFDQYRIFYGQASNEAAANDFLKERISFGQSTIFLAYLPDQVPSNAVGFTLLYPLFSSVRLTQNWVLNDLYIHPDFRRQQIAKELINTAISFAKSTGAGFLQLETAHDNIPAQTLYEASGFRRQSADNNYLLYRIDLLK